MAMIKCFECKKKVSTHAEQCTHCGVSFNLDNLTHLPKRDRRKAEKFVKEATALNNTPSMGKQLLAAIVVGVPIFFAFKSVSPENNPFMSDGSPSVPKPVASSYPCTTALSGEIIGVNSAIKRRLKDPNSYDHIGTQVSKVANENGEREIIVSYRAKNGFGGYNNSTAIGAYNPTTCEITAIALVE